MPVTQQLASEEVARIWDEFIQDRTNQCLRNTLIEHYMPMVKYIGDKVWSRLPDEVELDDLVSAGVFGLMDAIDAYDLSRGVKFETYCVPRIRGAMLDELRNMDWVPRLVSVPGRNSSWRRARSSPTGSVDRRPPMNWPSTCPSVPPSLTG